MNNEAQEFFDAVAQLPAPKHRKHEVEAIKKLIPPQPEVEVQPVTFRFFARCEAFKSCGLCAFVGHLTNIGVDDPMRKVGKWVDARHYQFITVPLETVDHDYRQITKYTFRGHKIFLWSANPNSR